MDARRAAIPANGPHGDVLTISDADAVSSVRSSTDLRRPLRTAPRDRRRGLLDRAAALSASSYALALCFWKPAHRPVRGAAAPRKRDARQEIHQLRQQGQQKIYARGAELLQASITNSAAAPANTTKRQQVVHRSISSRVRAPYLMTSRTATTVIFRACDQPHLLSVTGHLTTPETINVQW